MEHPLRIVGAVILVVSGTLVGCESSGTAEEPTTPASSDVPDTAGEMPTTGSSDADTSTLVRDNSLKPYLDAYEQLARLDRATRSQVQADVDLYVASCMKEQGFEYFPRPAAEYAEELARMESSLSIAAERTPLNEEWVSEHGLGIVDGTLLGKMDQLRSEDYSVTQNEEYRASLSPAAQESYDRALSAEGDDGTTVGCLIDAETEVLGADYQAELLTPPFQSLYDEFGLLVRTWSADPRVVAAEEEFGTCLADAGFGDVDLNELNRQYYAADHTDTGAMDLPPSEYRALLDQEIATGMARLDCFEETGYWDIRHEVEEGLVQEFLVTHQGELDGLALAAAELH